MATMSVISASKSFLYNQNKLILFSIFKHPKPTFSFPHKPSKNLTFFAPTTRCIHSAQQSLETKNQDMGLNQRPNIVNILEERGLLESVTSENLRLVCSSNSNPMKAYCGFDPTADSLHLGNLIGIIVLSWFQRCGHNAVAVIGGATARVGDPSGKNIERPELDVQTLESNTLGIVQTISNILGRYHDQNRNGNPNSGGLMILNNFDWWKEVKLLDFLRNVGRYARVGTMMAKDRINVQIGGSDQWGNITAGTELIRKILQVEGAYGLTFPLLLKSDGTKFGKSEDGAIWLSPSVLSPYKFYQYFFSVPDVDVVRFLKILTFLSLEEIKEVEEGMRKPGYVPNSAQRKLAEEVTRFVHGEEGLQEALKATEALKPGAETKLDWKTIEGIAKDVPSCYLSYDQVLNASVINLSVTTGLFESKSSVRRMLKSGGLYLNNARVSEEKCIEAGDIIDGKVLLLSSGKKNKMVVRIS
ncbi:hypothetical protein MKX01_001110 [Papaver californicum]|nr:hypothetical protein MKX01_001110 [Papaver californicum]